MSDLYIERISVIDDEIVEAATRLSALLGSSNQVTITAKYLERITTNPDVYLLMARRERGERFIGMASLIIMPMPTNVRASLENIAVDESARGEGIGTALCQEVRTIADNLGVNTLRAATSPNNIASQTMLKKSGFIVDTDLDHFELNIQQGPRF